MPSPRPPRPSLPSVPLPAPRLVVFLSSPSIQFDHGRFSEMRSQMGNASWPKGASDSVSQLEFTGGRGAAAGGVDGFRGKINRWCSLESDFCSPAKAVKVCRPSEEASPLDRPRPRPEDPLLATAWTHELYLHV